MSGLLSTSKEARGPDPASRSPQSEPSSDPSPDPRALDPSRLTYADLLSLQRTIGNRAVLRLMRARSSTAVSPLGAVVQREVGQPETSAQTGEAAGEQAAGTQAAGQSEARSDYVFIMGEDAPDTRNRFYHYAELYYQRTYPQATIVPSVRSLRSLLDYLRANVSAPIGHLYIVSHASQEGILSFGLNDADLQQPGQQPEQTPGGQTGDSLISPGELRDALDSDVLPRLSGQVDSRTTIHIRGCNIGQSQDMVDLVDQAFGGHSNVSAPTHEQTYGGNETSAYEATTGPFIGRPGATRFTLEEVTAHVDSTYAHLPARRRAQIAQQLFRNQQEQSSAHPVFEQELPRDAAEARRIYAEALADRGFTPGPAPEDPAATDPYVTITGEDAVTAGGEHTTTFRNVEGASSEITHTVPTDAEAMQDARDNATDYANYSWSVERGRSDKGVTVDVVGRRIHAELLSESLDASSESHFAPPESDRRFYTTPSEPQ